MIKAEGEACPHPGDCEQVTSLALAIVIFVIFVACCAVCICLQIRKARRRGALNRNVGQVVGGVVTDEKDGFLDPKEKGKIQAGIPGDSDLSTDEAIAMAYKVGEIADDANVLEISRENELYGSLVVKNDVGQNEKVKN